MSGKPRLAFLSQPFDTVLPPGQNSLGLWTHEVARRLVDDYEVHVIAKSRQSLDSLEVEGVRYRLCPVRPGAFDMFLDPRQPSNPDAPHRPLVVLDDYAAEYITAAVHYLREQQIEIVHIHNFSQYVPPIARGAPGSKIVLHMSCDWLSDLERALVSPRLERVEVIVGCSGHVTNRVRQRFPSLRAGMATVPNGVDVHQFDRTASDAPQRAAGGAIIYVGRISPEKGCHVLLEAFREILAAVPDAVLRMVGGEAVVPIDLLVLLSSDRRTRALSGWYAGSYMKAVCEMAAAHGEAVKMMGWVAHHQLPAQLSQADVLVCPSVCHEAFGMPIVEAMACGLPVVATRGGGIPEIVVDGSTGLLVERGDAGALADALTVLLRDPERARAMGRAGRERAVACFSWERVAAELRHVYQGLG